jgi:hypothetical protein
MVARAEIQVNLICYAHKRGGAEQESDARAAQSNRPL